MTLTARVIKRNGTEKQPKLFNQSFKVKLFMVSGCTHTHTHTYTHTYINAYFGGMKVNIRNQAHASLWPACSWFKNSLA